MLTALIVEDEPLMREYLLFNLSSIHDQWITAACAKDGVEAMALLNEQHFDLIITDIKMPRMTGVELATYVHNNIADTDIIFLTGYDELNIAVIICIINILTTHVQQSAVVFQTICLNRFRTQNCTPFSINWQRNVLPERPGKQFPK